LKKMISPLYRDRRATSTLTIVVVLVVSLVMLAPLADIALSPEEKGGIAVFSGLDNGSNLHLRGDVLAFSTLDTDRGGIAEITFIVAIAEDGEPVRFTMTEDSNGDGRLGDEPMPLHTVRISYVDEFQRVDNLTWKFAEHGPGDGDNLLEAGENFRITVGADKSGRCNLLNYALSPGLGVETTFTLEVRIPGGEIIRIERTTLARLDAVMNLN